MTKVLQSAYSQAVAVSWQTLNREEVERRLNSDRYPDFRWYRASDDYDPEQVNFDIWDTEGAATLYDFFGDEDGYSVALQIDMLRPAADLLELRYPDQGAFTLLDVDSVILAHSAAAAIAKHWLCLCTTTLDDAPISFARRSLIFPSLERFNRQLRWEYEEIAPSASFARKLEAALNHWLPLRMKFYHWTNTISASGHHVVDPDFDAIFRNVTSAR